MTDSSQGWYVRRSGFAIDYGPYAWTDLVAFARSGNVVADDLVWHGSWPEWRTAGGIPELASQLQPKAQPAGAQSAPARPRNRRRIVALLTTAAVVALLGGVGLVWLLLGSGSEGGGPSLGGPSLGAAEAKVPDRASLIETAEWGEVPANQLCVLMVDGSRRSDAEKVASAIDGTVVGEVEFVALYQIEFPGTTEADLTSAIQRAETESGVEHAFPNQQIYGDAEIWGKRVDPYDDPAYGGVAGEGYKAIGVAQAWTYIKGANVDLSPVKVGVVDDGIYLPGDGAENEFEGGQTKVEYPDPSAGELAAPNVWEDGVTNPAGSHGTGVSTVIGADPDNGGPVGVAGPLGSNLTISMINHYTGQYGDALSTPDPDDPTKYVGADGKTYTEGSLVAITKQIANNADVINLSWGASNAHPGTVAAYRRFFEKMAEQHPGVVFVCSGGNGGTVMDGDKRIPSGLKLPNMITVGALDPDGATARYADKASANYEITLGAPGTGAVVGLKPEGGLEQQNGSSFAAPQVAAAAAILKSLNPKLTAGQIKTILAETARPGVPNTSDDPTATSKLVDTTEMGAGILAVDEAVLRVINEMRAATDLEPLTPELLEKMGVVDAVAITGEPGEYTVKGIVGGAAAGETKLTITITGANNSLGGNSSQAVSAPGEGTWSVTLPEGKGTITVKREDNGAASIITIDRDVLEGTWQYPETMRIMGGAPQKTGATITIRIVRDGNGYKMDTPWPDATVTLEGDTVTIVQRYSGLLPGEPGGVSTYTGTLGGDTITGTQEDTYNGMMEWIATRAE